MTTSRAARIPLAIGWGLVSIILLALLTSCTRESDHIDLVEVPPPSGGKASALTRLEPPSEDEAGAMVAASHAHLYIRPTGADRWQRRSVSWPSDVRSPGRPPTEGLSPPNSSFNFPQSTRLTSRAGHVWMLTRPQVNQGPVLMVGRDGGKTWELAPLPPFYQRRNPGARDGTARSSADLTQIDTRTPLRLSNHGRHGLYLLDGHRVWRAIFEEDEASTIDEWKPLDLSGIEPHEVPTGQSFPSVIRNYLPATEHRPFELLTVFGERLYVYRRPRESERWILVSTLPAIDRALFGYTGTDLVYLLSPETLYRTTERGERWEGLPLSRSVTQSEITTATFLGEPDEPDGERERPGLPTVLLGTEAGSIYRSRYQQDEPNQDVWELVRPPDPDRRTIAHLATSPDGESVWASTRGVGLLRSTDGGDTWTRASRGLRASQPLDIAIGDSGALMLGTEAGLFRLTGAPEEGHWSQLHGRASSALERTRGSGRTFSGTFGGAIVSEAADGPVTPGRREDETPEQGPPPLFQPWSAPSLLLPASAVFSIRERPDSEDIFAWTHQRGLLHSSDAGISWWHVPLNPGLLSTLQQSAVTNFIVGRGERMYLTSHSLDRPSTPVRLWRSSNDGETWRSVYTFSESFPGVPLLLRRTPRQSSGTLYLGYGDRLARSIDGGDGWRDLEGPWERGRIYAYDVERRRQTLVYNTRHASHLALLSNLEGTNDPEVRTYQLHWPGRSDLRRPDVRHVIRHQQFVYVTTPSHIFAGVFPEERVQVPHAPTIITTLLFVLAITGLSFWYLRIEPE